MNVLARLKTKLPSKEQKEVTIVIPKQMPATQGPSNVEKEPILNAVKEEVPSNTALNYAGVILSAISGIFYLFIKTIWE